MDGERDDRTTTAQGPKLASREAHKGNQAHLGVANVITLGECTLGNQCHHPEGTNIDTTRTDERHDDERCDTRERERKRTPKHTAS